MAKDMENEFTFQYGEIKSGLIGRLQPIIWKIYIPVWRD